MTPYYSDDTTTLYLGDCREVLPALGITANLVATDPPYGETALAWEKPVEILVPLIEYACPPGGLMVDPFAGSGSALVAARESGRRAVGVEAREEYAEAAARRLAAPRQGVLL